MPNAEPIIGFASLAERPKKSKKPELAAAGDIFRLPRDLDVNIFIQTGIHAGHFFTTNFTYEFSEAYDNKPFIVVQAGPTAKFSDKGKSIIVDGFRHCLVLLPLNDNGTIATEGPLITANQWDADRLASVARTCAPGTKRIESISPRSTKLDVIDRRPDLVEDLHAKGVLDEIIRAAAHVREQEEAALKAEIKLSVAGCARFLKKLEGRGYQDMLDATLRNIESSLESEAQQAAGTEPLLPKAIRTGTRIMLARS